MKYFIIECDEDGEISVKEYTKDALELIINDPETSWKFLSKLENSEPVYWDGCLIIKGEIVTPTPVSSVTKYTI